MQKQCIPIYRLLLLLGLVFCLNFKVASQIRHQLDLEKLDQRARIELPFTLENDFIILNVFLNNWLPLKFLLDTGAENTLIVDKSLTDYLNLNYTRKFEVTGADLDSVITAYLATGINLRISDRLLARNRTMLVLKKNYFHFERVVGIEIHGILGADFLSRFIMEIDYKRQLVILHEPADFKLSRKHLELPSRFIRNRPYVSIPLSVSGRKIVDNRLLLDTGAGLYLLLYSGENSKGELPERVISTTIAQGLGGAVKGNVGRVKSVTMANQEIGNVVTYFQQVDPEVVDSTQLLLREGVLGNSLLRRYNLVVDYVNKKVFVRPTSKTRKPITFDRSGLLISATGPQLTRFVITSVLPGSPAEEAGLKVGDRIKAINGTTTDLMSLSALIRKLEGKPGKRIRLKIRRYQETDMYEFRLRNLI